VPYKIKSVTDTPPERVAHSLQRAPARQSPTPLGPGRNDLFHGGVPEDFIRAVWNTMAATSIHTYQILTKRHGRMRSLLQRWASDQPPLPNVHLGVSCEDAHWAAIRLPALGATPAALRFISAEPLLGPVTLGPALASLRWVIIGGESGPGARPLDLGWVRELVAECLDAGVAVFLKQLGTCWAREHGGPRRAETRNCGQRTCASANTPKIRGGSAMTEPESPDPTVEGTPLGDLLSRTAARHQRSPV
jgi:protein gp37